jgi:hypothetical protein
MFRPVNGLGRRAGDGQLPRTIARGRIQQETSWR